MTKRIMFEHLRFFFTDVYTLTFQATGCIHPGPTTLKFWTEGPDDRTFRDMMSYCELTRTNRASPAQRNVCCGSDSCVINKCTKQTKFVGGK